MKDQYKSLWLHDEDQEFNIIPYTTLDNIKIQTKKDFIDFSSNYQNLENTHSNNEINADILEENINNTAEIFYGLTDPLSTEGKNGDLYIQHKNNEIIKIWQKRNNIWVYFEGNSGANIKIGNIDTSSKPQIGITIKVSNAP